MSWRLNLRQLEAFRAVTMTGTTTQAAQALNVSQPAISRLIKDLETQLGVSLFVRRHGRLHPTPEANWLYEESETALARLDRLDMMVRDIRHVQRREMRIMSTPPMSHGMLPRAFKTFYQEHPEVSVSLQVAERRENRNWTSAQQFDIALATFPIEYPEEAILRLVRVPGVCIFPKGHRFRSKKVIHAKDIGSERMIALTTGALNRFHIDRMFENLGLQRQIAIEAQTASAVCAVVSSGLGVAVVDPFSARVFMGTGFDIRPFEPAIEYEYGILFPIRQPRATAAEAFVAHIEKSVDETVEWYDAKFKGWHKLVRRGARAARPRNDMDDYDFR